MSTALVLNIWRRTFGVRRSAFPSAHEQEHEHGRSKSNYPSKVVWPFHSKWTVDTLPRGQKLLFKCKLKLRARITLKQRD